MRRWEGRRERGEDREVEEKREMGRGREGLQ